MQNNWRMNGMDEEEKNVSKDKTTENIYVVLF